MENSANSLQLIIVTTLVVVAISISIVGVMQAVTTTILFLLSFSIYIYATIVSGIVLLIATLFSLYRVAVSMRAHKKISWPMAILTLAYYTAIVVAIFIVAVQFSLPMIIKTHFPWSADSPYGEVMTFVYNSAFAGFAGLKVSTVIAGVTLASTMLSGFHMPGYIGVDVDDIEMLVLEANLNGLSDDTHGRISKWIKDTHENVSGLSRPTTTVDIGAVAELAVAFKGGWVALLYKVVPGLFVGADFRIWSPCISGAFSWVGCVYLYNLFCDDTAIKTIYDDHPTYHPVYTVCAAWQVATAIYQHFNSVNVVDAAFLKRYRAIRKKYTALCSGHRLVGS